MTTLFLIRHATTAATGKRLGGRTTASLDEGGRGQAERAGQRLADVPFKSIYTSPLPRTSETAAAVAAPHGLEPIPVEGLLEVEYGTWTDRPLKSVARTKVWPVVQQRPSLVTFPEGESIRAMQLRAVGALEELVAAHPKDVIAAVSHADVIKAVVAFYLGLPLDLFQRLVVAPTSATVLQLSVGGQPALVRFNDDGPLDAARFKRSSSPKPKKRKAAAPQKGASTPEPEEDA